MISVYLLLDSCENAPKNHCFTKHIEKFICRSGFSNGFCGIFSGQVGARIGDIEFRKVKRYLFSTLHFLQFYVTTQVVYCWLGAHRRHHSTHNLLNFQDRSVIYYLPRCVLPIYDLINYLSLLRCCATEIDASCFYAFMSHEVSKESNIVESFKEVLCESMTERMRINDLFG